MANGKRTRFALVRSLLCAALCLALLVGTTFAWFSDEAKTGDTTITAGNLDVELIGATEKEDGGYQPGEPIGERDSVFTGLEGFLWEPGAMFASDPFMVNNAGTLALYYKLNVKMTNAATDPETPDITEVIKWKLVFAGKAGDLPADGASAEERQAFWESIGGDETSAHSGEGMLMAGNHGMAWRVVLYWEPSPSTAISPEENPDNKYNLSADKYGADGANAPKADFSLDVFATQASFESDSFGAGYDAPAKDMVPVEVSDEAGLDAAFESGQKNIVITGDIYLNDTQEMSNYSVKPGVTVDGGGNTIYSSHKSDSTGTPVFAITGEEDSEPSIFKNITVTHSGNVARGPVVIQVGQNAKAVLENVNVTGFVDCAIDFVKTGGEITANNCGFEGTWATIRTRNGNKLTMTDCTVNCSFPARDIEKGNSIRDRGVIVFSSGNYDGTEVRLSGCHLNANVANDINVNQAYCMYASGGISATNESVQSSLAQVFGLGAWEDFAQFITDNDVKINDAPATLDNLFCIEL